MTTELDAAYAHYKDQQAQFADEYEGAVIVVAPSGHDDFLVLGPFETENLAIAAALAQGLTLGKFLVQRVARHDEPAVFHSRVRI